MGILMETSEVNLVGASRLSIEPDLFGTMSAPGEYYETLHTIAINTRETEFGSYVEPIPITLKAYKQIQTLGHPANGYGLQQSVITPMRDAPRADTQDAPGSVIVQSPVKEDTSKVARPPKKKWIKEYLEEEPELPVSVRVTEVLVSRSNGVVRPPSPVPLAPAAAPAPPAAAPPPPPPALAALAAEPVPAAPILDFAQEHSRPRTTNGSHGPSQIPSPPSVGSSGSGSSGSGGGGSGSGGGAPRAGTREVHNKLEKNRRAHLKECFELLKRQLPAAPDDKKTSNLSILGSAIRYIQVLRRKERECEHEMERLAREKIASQQRLAALKREVTIRTTTVRPRSVDAAEEKERDDNIINGQVLGIPISITSSPPRPASRAETPPPRTLNLSTKLRTLPIQISPTTSQVVRARPGSLTVTTLAAGLQPGRAGAGAGAGGAAHPAHPAHPALPAHLHLPISQMAGGGVLVAPAALQLLAAGGLRVLHANGVPEGGRRAGDAGGGGGGGGGGGAPPALAVVSAVTTVTTVTTDVGGAAVGGAAVGGVVVGGAVVGGLAGSPAARLLHAPKVVEGQMVKGSVAPLAVSAQYLSATTIVKPVVVVTSAHSPAPPT